MKVFSRVWEPGALFYPLPSLVSRMPEYRRQIMMYLECRGPEFDQTHIFLHFQESDWHISYLNELCSLDDMLEYWYRVA